MKHQETGSAEKKAEEKRKEEAAKVEENRKKEASGKQGEKAAAMARWETGELSQAEWGTYKTAANPIQDLAGDSEVLEEVAAGQQIAYKVGMRALGDQWEEERARAQVTRQTPQPRQQQQRHQQQPVQPRVWQLQQRQQQEVTPRGPQQPQQANWAQRVAAEAALPQSDYRHVGRNGKME